MGRRVLRFFFGVLLVVVGAFFVLGALTTLGAERDDDGFFTAESQPFATESYAATADYYEVKTDAPWWLIELLADPNDVRITATAAGGESVFVGIAPTRQAERYISDVAVAAAPNPPSNETLWVSSSEGMGTHTLEWDIAFARLTGRPTLEEGNWTVLVMNTDATADVSADLTAGTSYPRVPLLIGTGVAFGIVFILGGVYLIYRAFRPRAFDPLARKPKLDESGMDAGFTALQGYNPARDS
ncbi:MAG: hypothetical protein QNJ77_05420 [Acidimicrobiia bacterium]|nr:hypothetical protein [Acidimicrobiia bacterium]